MDGLIKDKDKKYFYIIIILTILVSIWFIFNLYNLFNYQKTSAEVESVHYSVYSYDSIIPIAEVNYVLNSTQRGYEVKDKQIMDTIEHIPKNYSSNVMLSLFTFFLLKKGDSVNILYKEKLSYTNSNIHSEYKVRLYSILDLLIFPLIALSLCIFSLFRNKFRPYIIYIFVAYLLLYILIGVLSITK